MGGSESKRKRDLAKKSQSSSSSSGGPKMGLKSVDLTNTTEYQEYLKMVNHKNAKNFENFESGGRQMDSAFSQLLQKNQSVKINSPPKIKEKADKFKSCFIKRGQFLYIQCQFCMSSLNEFTVSMPFGYLDLDINKTGIA